jgi:hypothetical protein
MLRKLLFSPAVFFAEIAQETESLIWPFLIAMLGGIGMIASSVFYTVFLHTGSRDSALASFSATLSNHYVFMVPLIMWVIVSVTIFAVSRGFSGTGSLVSTFRNTGYGMLPVNLYTGGFEVLTSWFMIIFGEFPRYAEIPPARFLRVLGLLWLVFLVWTWCLWVVGTEKSHNISRTRAIIPVACAVLVEGVVTVLWFMY